MVACCSINFLGLFGRWFSSRRGSSKKGKFLCYLLEATAVGWVAALHPLRHEPFKIDEIYISTFIDIGAVAPVGPGAIIAQPGQREYRPIISVYVTIRQQIGVEVFGTRVAANRRRTMQ